MNWIQITDAGDLDRIKEESKQHPVMIFKHSTRCSISGMALNRLERSWSDQEVAPLKPYFLDLIRYRDISDRIAELFKIRHESPQVLVIKDEEVIYDNSHMGINYDSIKDTVKN